MLKTMVDHVINDNCRKWPYLISNKLKTFIGKWGSKWCTTVHRKWNCEVITLEIVIMSLLAQPAPSTKLSHTEK